jgi:DMSO reductase anchor subunit
VPTASAIAHIPFAIAFQLRRVVTLSLSLAAWIAPHRYQVHHAASLALFVLQQLGDLSLRHVCYLGKLAGNMISLKACLISVSRLYLKKFHY